jgi:phosphate transport system substrate-binding protein
MKPVAALVCLSLVAALPLHAELTGVIRIAGNPELASRVSYWAEAFRRQYPAVRVETHLTGSDTGMAALYTGKADVALLGRSPTPIEIQAFEWIFRYKPTQVQVLTGGLDHPGRSPALVVFVHRDNPLCSLTLAQLEAVFGTEHRRSAGNLRTWGDLGLGGEWADRPITLYAPDAMSGTGRFFRHAVLGDSRMMNWEALTEFTDSADARTPHDASRQIIAALAGDRYGIAVTNLGFPDDRVKPLPLAIDAATAPVPATRDTVLAREYPLTRAVTACCNWPPGVPPDLAVSEFLRFVLSEEGQQDQGDGYLPCRIYSHEQPLSPRN